MPTKEEISAEPVRFESAKEALEALGIMLSREAAEAVEAHEQTLRDSLAEKDAAISAAEAQRDRDVEALRGDIADREAQIALLQLPAEEAALAREEAAYAARGEQLQALRAQLAARRAALTADAKE